MQLITRGTAQNNWAHQPSLQEGTAACGSSNSREISGVIKSCMHVHWPDPAVQLQAAQLLHEAAPMISDEELMHGM